MGPTNKGNKFKVGDWVYCNYPDHPEQDYVMQVIDIDNQGWMTGIWSTTGRKNGHHWSYYRLATSDEVAMAGFMYDIY